MATKRPSTRSGITPLAVIATFLGLCETVAGAVATQQAGWTQSCLVIFVVVFPVLIAGGFFWILWHRNYVLYPPSEYEGDPASFVDAMQKRTIELQPVLQQQIALVEKMEKSPEDPTPKFELLATLIEKAHLQCVILMHEQSIALPASSFYSLEQQIRTGSPGSWYTSSSYSGQGLCSKFSGTGVLQVELDLRIRLTQMGHEFARWLIENGFKADFFKSPFGNWGHCPDDAKDFFRRADGKADAPAEP